MSKVQIGIIGGTGYTGVELLRLLVAHPEVQLKVITSRSEAGKPVADLYPSLRGHTDLRFRKPEPDAYQECDLVFSATPNGIAMQNAEMLLENGVRLIDLAADFRLQDIAQWEDWYGMKHACPHLVSEAIYGLPEVNREAIRKANIVANPGCYPTASTLALVPLLKAGLVDVSDIVIDAKSGVSGAGKTASVNNLFSEVADSFKAYGASAHRHHPEIAANLQNLADQKVGLTFVPHLVPMLRGIHATVYANLLDPLQSVEELTEVFQQVYSQEPFVDVMPIGSHPETRSVKSSNICRVALHKATGSSKLVVLSVIDNLTKGAAGQAIQNMNIMFGFDETTGLNNPALMP